MGDMKRFRPTGCERECDEYCTPVGMVEDSNGDHVLHADHLKAMAKRDELLTEARGIINDAHMASGGDFSRTESRAWHDRRRSWLASMLAVKR